MYSEECTSASNPSSKGDDAKRGVPVCEWPLAVGEPRCSTAGEANAAFRCLISFCIPLCAFIMRYDEENSRPGDACAF
jgi:hypothetical protein